MCLFEPPSAASNFLSDTVVAIAGGNMIARIDCEQAAVKSAYFDPEGQKRVFDFLIF